MTYDRGTLAALKDANDRAEAAEAQRDALVKALKQIADGDVPRPMGRRYRSDGVPSKNDQCVHSTWMYEDCGNCISEFATAALAAATDATSRAGVSDEQTSPQRLPQGE